MLKAALLHFTGDTPFVHELLFLAQALRAHLPRLSEEFSEELKRLSEYYVSARYPNDLPYEAFTWERAEAAFAAAQEIAGVIKEAIKL